MMTGEKLLEKLQEIQTNNPEALKGAVVIEHPSSGRTFAIAETQAITDDHDQTVKLWAVKY